MNCKRRVLVGVACLASIWLVLSGSIGVIAIEAALHPVRRPLLDTDEKLAHSIAAQDRATLTSVSIDAADGADLRENPSVFFAAPGTLLSYTYRSPFTL